MRQQIKLRACRYYGQPYDYFCERASVGAQSRPHAKTRVAAIMHYDRLAFSKNGRDTLVARQPGMTTIIGAALDFSPIDLVKIQAMYNCAAPPESVVSGARVRKRREPLKTL